MRRQGSPLPTFVDIEYLGLSITSPISESIALIFVSILCIPDLWLNHVLSESVSKKSLSFDLAFCGSFTFIICFVIFDMYNNTDFTIYIHTHARAQNLVELQKNGSQEKNYRI